jgi:zinc protease
MRFIRVLLLIVQCLAPAVASAMTIERVVSPGGIEAWLVRDRTIPVLALEFTFRGGSALEPAGKGGTAGLLTSMLLEGAGDLTSQQFQGLLEDKAISMGFDAGVDSMNGSLKTLTENLDQAVDLLRLAMTRPRFDEVDFNRIKTRTEIGLRRSLEEPRTIAGQTWMETAFPGHAYGRPSRGTPASVATVTPDDLRAFLKARFARDNLIVGASGDVEPAALGRLLDRIFGELPAKAAAIDVADTKPAGGGRTIVIKKSVPQSVVMFGEIGVKRDDPDFYAATIVNYIMGGGGFNSRLTTEVREKRGLAYSVYSYLAPYDRTGLLMGGTATENARVGQSIEVIMREWKRMHDEGPTEEELRDAKTYLTGSFPLQLDSTGRIARLMVSIQYDNLGIDYIDKRAALIGGVTLADAQRVSRRLFAADQLLTVVVGEPAGLASASPEDGGKRPQ